MKFTHLTFNTMGAPLKPRTPWRFERIGKILIRLAREKDIDFITLQETYPTRLRDRLIIQPWREDFGYAECTDEKGWHLEQAGLTTLSKREILHSRFYGYRRCGYVDALVNKGVLFTRLRFEVGELDVYNTHTQASYLSQRQRSRIRIAQIRELIAFIKQTHKPENPVLLTGDLNCEEYNEGYRLLVNPSDGAQPFVDVMRRLHPDTELYPLKTLRRTNVFDERKLDHVLIRPGEHWEWVRGESTSEVLDFGLSDHRAVLSTIGFRAVLTTPQ